MLTDSQCNDVIDFAMFGGWKFGEKESTISDDYFGMEPRLNSDALRRLAYTEYLNMLAQSAVDYLIS